MDIPTQLKILFLTTLANWISKEKSHMIEYLLVANRILKSKLESDGRRIKYSDSERAILAKKGRKLSWSLLKKCEFLTPETILRWYNRLIAKKYTANNPNPSLAKQTKEYVRKIVCEMASSNINWGAGRIAGALKHIGIRRSKATVWRIMRDNGFDPLPNGGQHKVNKSWTAFVKSHFHLMCSADFFTAEVLTLRGFVRYMVFFVVDCTTRKVKIVHISNGFCGEVMERIAIQMTDYFDGLLKGKRFFFCDKDPLYTQKFKRILENSGIKVQQVPSPVCNPYAERFVKSIKDECLRNFIFLSEGMLHKAVSEYEIYYNTERPHQNLDNELISPKENEHYEELRLTREENKGKVLYKSAKDRSLIVKKQRLGGILNFYYRKAS